MVNRYITALLVVLAATGMEAQTYQQALKFVQADISYEEFIQQPEVKALEEDLLCAIKAIKEASDLQAKNQQHSYVATLPVSTTNILTLQQPCICFYPAIKHKYRAPYGSIVIRGPNFL